MRRSKKAWHELSARIRHKTIGRGKDACNRESLPRSVAEIASVWFCPELTVRVTTIIFVQFSAAALPSLMHCCTCEEEIKPAFTAVSSKCMHTSAEIAERSEFMTETVGIIEQCGIEHFVAAFFARPRRRPAGRPPACPNEPEFSGKSMLHQACPAPAWPTLNAAMDPTVFQELFRVHVCAAPQKLLPYWAVTKRTVAAPVRTSA